MVQIKKSSVEPFKQSVSEAEASINRPFPGRTTSKLHVLKPRQVPGEMCDSPDSPDKENALSATRETKESERKAAGDVVIVGFEDTSSTNLQERFARFRRERQRERKLANFVKKKRDRTPEFKESLRNKFVEGAKKYLGVPYAAKYHGPESEHFQAPLYIDCCALVRRTLQDLQEDFGFRIGRWNQNYQFDTLPIKLKSEDELRPGDLIFAEGRYFKPDGMRRQKYDLVHVEIFLGGETGEATIGARHQRGVVSVHPSFRYTSKSYEILKYHFCSIDTWLDGVCEPCHSEHWQSRDASIAGGPLLNAAGHRSVFEEAAECCDDSIDEDHHEEGKVFYVEKGNGWKLVAASLEKLGWKQLPFEYGFRTSFDLKWVQTRAQIDFVAHREGQLVNHIPNNTVITSKLGLLETLRECLTEDWFPETLRLDQPHECLKLLRRHEEIRQLEGEEPVWILKPASANCGKGIRIVDSINDLRRECFGDDQDRGGERDAVTNRLTPSLSAAIAQRYLTKPLLLQGRKFDLRMYMLISRASPVDGFKAYYAPGYARLSLEEYTPSHFDDPFVHLTNASVQRRHPSHRTNKQALDRVWTLRAVEAELVREGVVGPGWLCEELHGALRGILSTVMGAASRSLARRDGYFDLLGCDFMLHVVPAARAFPQPVLLEINTNPALHTDSPTLEAVLPPLVDEAIQIVLKDNGHIANEVEYSCFTPLQFT